MSFNNFITLHADMLCNGYEHVDEEGQHYYYRVYDDVYVIFVHCTKETHNKHYRILTGHYKINPLESIEIDIRDDYFCHRIKRKFGNLKEIEKIAKNHIEFYTKTVSNLNPYYSGREYPLSSLQHLQAELTSKGYTPCASECSKSYKKDYGKYFIEIGLGIHDETFSSKVRVCIGDDCELNADMWTTDLGRIEEVANQYYAWAVENKQTIKGQE